MTEADLIPNWFTNDGEQNFIKFVAPELQQKQSRLLQIGAYTGDASVWLYNNVLKHNDSVLVDVDTWEGSNEVAHKYLHWGSIENLYDAKTAAGRQERKIVKFKQTSDAFFRNNREMYDFIYVDGDHTSYGVIKDAVNSYECLNLGGIIAFDDYQWMGDKNPVNRPRMAIDFFLEIYRERVEVMLKEYQCWVKKVA